MLHTSGRTDLWGHAIDDAMGNPISGSGPMRYACEADHYIAGSPHSFPFQILGEWGIPAFLILAILFIWLVRAWFHASKRLKQEPAYRQASISVLSISCLAAVVHVCVSGLLVAPSSQVAAMLVTGWLLGSLFKASYDSTENESTGYDAVLLLLLGFVASVSVVVFSTTELNKLSYRTSYAQDYGPTTPRFWQDGRFCEYSF
jgi:O-antigen ligase